MAKTLSPEELAALEAGDAEGDDEPEVVDEDVDDEGDEPEPEPEPAKAAAGPQQDVPYDRFHQQVEENQRLRDMLGNLTEVVRQGTAGRTAPAAPSRPTYSRADDTPDKRTWREFVGETVEPVVSAKLAEIEEQNRQTALAVGEALDDQKARAMFSDYGDYEADINQLRQNFYGAHHIAVPREYAYYVAKAMREQKQKGSANRNKAVRRASPAAAGSEAKPPAKAGSKGVLRITPENINGMSLKQMEAYLAKRNPRV